MYYVAPASCLFLSVPFLALEAPALARVGLAGLGRGTALASAGMAFALNCASFLLIGNTSALTLQLAGVFKDWLLIVMSAAVFRHALTPLNLGGYGAPPAARP